MYGAQMASQGAVMVILIVLVTVVVFIGVDFLLRHALKRVQEAKVRREREAALDIGLRLDLRDEAPSLKRVEVDKPRARILAVDDESVILDSFRKILVVAGFSVDTVESGPEALGLIYKNHYDFLFTDLKMPEMAGEDVVKAAKHLRPDVDIIVITGFATVESAVETMKHGATDYVQKPFTVDELTDMVNTFLIRREARLDKEIKPEILLVSPGVKESKSSHEVNVPAGVFISPYHSWATVNRNGVVRVGVDDFTSKTLGAFDAVELPSEGSQVSKGSPLFVLRQGSRSLSVPSPVSGTVATINEGLLDRPGLVRLKPYELGWMCTIVPTNLTSELRDLRIGDDAVEWYKDEIDRCTTMIRKIVHEEQGIAAAPVHSEETDKFRLDDTAWEEFGRVFIHREESTTAV
jgi:CheY-like chemotaxis protein